MSQDKNTVDDIKETAKEIYNNVSEVLTERVFRPMYFYFIISWSIINWKFLYVFLFADEKIIVEQKSILKVEYLSNLYQWSSWQEASYSLLFLVVLPAISAYLVVWWLSLLSEKFVKKNEEHKERIKSVKKLILEKEKFYFENEMVQLREIESKKQQIKYEDNSEYNDYLDGLQDNITIGNITILPSRALYENDYGAYKVGLDEFKDSDE